MSVVYTSAPPVWFLTQSLLSLPKAWHISPLSDPQNHTPSRRLHLSVKEPDCFDTVVEFSLHHFLPETTPHGKYINASVPLTNKACGRCISPAKI